MALLFDQYPGGRVREAIETLVALPRSSASRTRRTTARTVRGPITLAAEAKGGGHRVEVTLPPDTPGEPQVPLGTAAPFPALAPDEKLRLSRYALPLGATSRFELPRPPGA